MCHAGWLLPVGPSVQPVPPVVCRRKKGVLLENPAQLHNLIWLCVLEPLRAEQRAEPLTFQTDLWLAVLCPALNRIPQKVTANLLGCPDAVGQCFRCL